MKRARAASVLGGSDPQVKIELLDDVDDVVGDAEAPDFVDVVSVVAESEDSRMVFSVNTRGEVPQGMPDPTTTLGIAIDLYYGTKTRVSLLATSEMDGWKVTVDRDGSQIISKAKLTIEGSAMAISVPRSELAKRSFKGWVASFVYVTDAGLDSQSSSYDRVPERGEAPAG